MESEVKQVFLTTDTVFLVTPYSGNQCDRDILIQKGDIVARAGKLSSTPLELESTLY